MSVSVVDSVELANRLRPVLLMLNRHLRREAHAEGITGGQAALLAQIRNHPQLGVRELAAREGISAPSMTRYLDRLEKAGLIVRIALARGRAADPPRADAEGRPRAPVGAAPAHRLARRAARRALPAELRAVDEAIEPLERLLEEDDGDRARSLALNSRTFVEPAARTGTTACYFTGQIVSVTGTWMQDTALPWLILGLTHSPMYVGALVFARYAPFLVFGLFSGVAADRFDNRRVVIVTQTRARWSSPPRSPCSRSPASRTMWPYFVLAFLGGAALVFDAPNRHASPIQLVGRDELPNAIALNSSLFNAGRVVGPALGGVLIAVVGSGWCFAINAGSFLAVLAALAADARLGALPGGAQLSGGEDRRRDPRGPALRPADARGAHRAA